MLYDIRLTISHRYESPAASGRHLVRVLPRAIPGRQQPVAWLLEVSPLPDMRRDAHDFFGTAVTTVLHKDPHDGMELRMACRVGVFAPEPWTGPELDPAALADALAQHRGLDPDSPLHGLGPSPRLFPDPAIAGFARAVRSPRETVAQTVARIGGALHAEMTFDAGATTVDTDPATAFAQRRGVCQDLSHIMILALRSCGIPAGYVSGYLRTLPPEGGVRLEGVDAMHAWVRAWCGPDQGWIEYDPTNATAVGTDHIVVGYGRDYSDVSPVIGHLRASGAQSNAQAVDVACVEPHDPIPGPFAPDAFAPTPFAPNLIPSGPVTPERFS